MAGSGASTGDSQGIDADPHAISTFATEADGFATTLDSDVGPGPLAKIYVAGTSQFGAGQNFHTHHQDVVAQLVGFLTDAVTGMRTLSAGAGIIATELVSTDDANRKRLEAVNQQALQTGSDLSLPHVTATRSTQSLTSREVAETFTDQPPATGGATTGGYPGPKRAGGSLTDAPAAQGGWGVTDLRTPATGASQSGWGVTDLRTPATGTPQSGWGVTDLRTPAPSPTAAARPGATPNGSSNWTVNDLAGAAAGASATAPQSSAAPTRPAAGQRGDAPAPGDASHPSGTAESAADGAARPTATPSPGQ